MTIPASPQSTANDRTEHGSTLVEVLVAMLVLIIGLVAMAQLLVVGTLAHADAAAATGATLDAQNKLEELLATGLDAPSLQVVTTNTLATDVTGYFDRTAAGRTRRWQVDLGPTAGTRIVRVRVIDRASRRFGSRVELRSMVRRR